MLVRQFIHVSKCHLHSWKIILSCYVAMILQMKDSWFANLTFRAHTCNRSVHALSCIMGNQGKFTKKKSCKTNIYLYISALISHLKTKHIL